MKDQITLLMCAPKLKMTKTWIGADECKEYDKAATFDAKHLAIDGIDDLYSELVEASKSPRKAVIRGEFIGADGDGISRGVGRSANGEDATVVDVEHHWVMIDIDKFQPVFADPLDFVEASLEFVAEVLPKEFHGKSFIWQASGTAGMGRAGGKLKCHLWFWLRDKVNSATLKGWCPKGVDPVVFNPTQPHYIAAPVFADGVVDPLEGVDRIGIVRGAGGDEVALSLEGVVVRSGAGGRELVDPSAKDGLIGWFHRAFSVDEVIDTLAPDNFVRVAGSDRRLNWVGVGSSGAKEGAWITEDRMHIGCSHESWPLGGVANLWDVVRVLRFGSEDQGVEDLLTIGVTMLPSQKAMTDFVRGLKMRTEKTDFQALREAASEVVDTDSYEEFKLKVRGLSRKELPDDLRAMLAGVLFETSGLGLNKSELKKALAAPKGGSSVDAPDWVAEWTFMTDKDTFRNLDTGVEMSKVGFHAAFARLMPTRETGERYNAAQWALENWTVPVCDRRMYMPMYEDKMLVVDGINTLNMFNVGTLPVMPAELSDAERETLAMIDEHMHRLFPNNRDRALITSFMAFMVQQMGRKVRWAPVVTNTIQGDGKSMIAAFVAAALGHENVQTINGRQLEEQYSSWAHGHMLVAVEEVKFDGDSAFTILNNFKTYITNDTVSVRDMYADTYNVPNITNYILFSNYTYSIPVKKDDRRYCMFRSPVTQAEILELQARGFYANLWDGIRAHGGAIRKWLMEYPICAEFLPNGVAPMTDAKRDVIAVNEDSGAGLEDLIADGHWGVTEDVIAVGELRKAMGFGEDAYMKRGYVKNVLSEHGYRPATWLNPEYKARLKGRTDRIWAKKEIQSSQIAAHFDADFNAKVSRKLEG
jgi:hypothetical protein